MLTKGFIPFFFWPPWLQLSAECVDLLDGVLHIDPSKRSTIPDIQAHPWMQQ